MASIDWNGRINAYLQRTGTVPPAASDILGALGSACQAAVERYIGRTLSTQSYTELYSGTGKNVLFLRHDPIVNVSAVSVNGSALTIQNPYAQSYPPSQVAINPTGDGLILTSGDVWDDFTPLNVQVSYTAGLADYYTDAPPDDILFVVTYWAAQFFRRRDRIGESTFSVGGQTSTFTSDIPADVKLMLDGYKRQFIPC